MVLGVLDASCPTVDAWPCRWLEAGGWGIACGLHGASVAIRGGAVVVSRETFRGCTGANWAGPTRGMLNPPLTRAIVEAKNLRQPKLPEIFVAEDEGFEPSRVSLPARVPGV